MMTFEEMEAMLDAKNPKAPELWKSIGRDALVYSTPLFSLRDAGKDESLIFAGSGTFLREGERYFILTANHVWEDSLRKGDAVGVALREVHDHRHFIETKAITPHGPESPRPWTNLGPDIVALEIPPNHVGTIKAMKGFYEMAGGQKAMVKGDHNYAFLLMGAPGVLGALTKRHASLQIYGMWDGTTASFTEGEWDYFDFNGALPPGTPGNSFGGVSGGGLWRVQVYPHPEEQEIASTVALEGVAFYQLGTFEGKGIIRCHGVNSIQKVLESV